MTTKELRQSLRRGSFVIPFLLIQFLAIVATVVEFQNRDGFLLKEGVGMLNPRLMWESGPFWGVVGLVCGLVLPFGGLVLMGQELEEGNHELLLLTKLDRWKVVLGKFLTLWGLCALTFVSLLPYVVVRYLLGGIEWWYELACSATVLGGSALICAGAIGASACRTIPGRIVVLAVYLISVLLGCGAALGLVAWGRGGCGFWYHVTALAAVFCYGVMGLALARSRLRLVVLAYEVKPSGMVIALLICAPFGIGLLSLVTAGWGAPLVLIGMGLVAIRLDVSPKAPKWVAPPTVNTPLKSL